MDSTVITPSIFTSHVPVQSKTPLQAAELSRNFSSLLDEALSNINTQQAEVNKLTNQLIKGDLTDVHQLMIASEKATLGLELTVQIRNKAVESYQEIMRMQI